MKILLKLILSLDTRLSFDENFWIHRPLGILAFKIMGNLHHLDMHDKKEIKSQF